jgi:hypothetical protein
VTDAYERGKPSTVRYHAAAHDAMRTHEQQALLLATAAKRAWEAWCRKDEMGALGDGVQGQDPVLDDAMRHLYRQIVETDVFYAGVAAGRQP